MTREEIVSRFPRLVRAMKREMESLCERRSVTADCVYGTGPYGVQKPQSEWDEWQKNCSPYRVTLRIQHGAQRRQMSVDFWCGPAWTTEPSAADVLSCLISDASALDQTFEEWCSDLGYNPDSRKAKATYDKCRKSGERVRRFLGFLFCEFARASH